MNQQRVFIVVDAQAPGAMSIMMGAPPRARFLALFGPTREQNLVLQSLDGEVREVETNFQDLKTAYAEGKENLLKAKKEFEDRLQNANENHEQIVKKLTEQVRAGADPKNFESTFASLIEIQKRLKKVNDEIKMTLETKDKVVDESSVNFQEAVSQSDLQSTQLPKLPSRAAPSERRSSASPGFAAGAYNTVRNAAGVFSKGAAALTNGASSAAGAAAGAAAGVATGVAAAAAGAAAGAAVAAVSRLQRGR
jgi:F0F1-type ATP synthase membrane subunit b/b'